VRNRQGRTLGSLVLYRAPGDPKFTRSEETVLEHVTAYLASGLEEGSCAQPVRDYSPTACRNAVISIDGHGSIVQLSREALKLLMLAHGGVTPGAVSRRPRREDFQTLDVLWRQQESGPRRERGSASATVENAWGRFAFECEPLQPVCAGDLPMLHVRVAQFEPRFVAVRRALGRLPLTPAQREVCALLHGGESQARIARALNVAVTTVADHVHKIYAKLDIHSASELNARISEAIRA
jgi:DNA-binding CsgD family transcriptional regulator